MESPWETAPKSAPKVVSEKNGRAVPRQARLALDGRPTATYFVTFKIRAKRIMNLATQQDGDPWLHSQPRTGGDAP